MPNSVCYFFLANFTKAILQERGICINYIMSAEKCSLIVYDSWQTLTGKCPIHPPWLYPEHCWLKVCPAVQDWRFGIGSPCLLLKEVAKKPKPGVKPDKIVKSDKRKPFQVHLYYSITVCIAFAFLNHMRKILQDKKISCRSRLAKILVVAQLKSNFKIENLVLLEHQNSNSVGISAWLTKEPFWPCHKNRNPTELIGRK